MKAVLIGLISLLAIGGTSAISQNVVTSNRTTPMTGLTEKRIEFERGIPERTLRSGYECYAEVSIFDTVAHPLVVNSDETCYWHIADADVDGDGILDTNLGYISRWCDECENGSCVSYSTYGMTSTLVTVVGSTPPEINISTYLNMDSSVIDYGFSDLPYGFELMHMGNLDVTGDGKPDAIIKAIVDWEDTCQGYDQESYYFYVENISQWPVACETDINNDGSTNTNDLLAVVGNWGPCE
jgi:hypothetical protein